MKPEIRAYIESETGIAADILRELTAKVLAGDSGSLVDELRSYVLHRFLVFDAVREDDDSFEYLGTLSIRHTLEITGGDLDAAGVITGCGGETTWVFKKMRILFAIQDALLVRFDPRMTPGIRTIEDLADEVLRLIAVDSGRVYLDEDASPQSKQMAIERIRGEFAIFSETDDERGLIYLDNAATMQVPRCVMDAVDGFLAGSYANVHRGIYELSERSTSRYEHARESVARHMNARPSEIVFTSGSTMGLNMVARALEEGLRPGDRVLVSEMEHHSNYLPWLEACRRTGATLEVAPVLPNGDLDLDTLGLMLEKPAKILAFSHCSNVTGSTTDVAKVCTLARGYGVTTVVDGAQGMSHCGADMRAFGCDFYVFSGHKLMAGPGSGVLYCREGFVENLASPLVGGGTIVDLEDDRMIPESFPWCWEAGTPNISGALTLEAALEFRARLGVDSIVKRESMLVAQLETGLSYCKGVEMLGAPLKRAGSISFTIAGLDALDACRELDRRGIAVRAGHHCAIPLHRAFHVQRSVRVSPAFYNTEDEIGFFLECVSEL